MTNGGLTRRKPLRFSLGVNHETKVLDVIVTGKDDARTQGTLRIDEIDRLMANLSFCQYALAARRCNSHFHIRLSATFPRVKAPQTPNVGSLLIGGRLEVKGGRHRIPAPAPLADRLRQSERRPECWCDRSSRTHNHTPQIGVVFVPLSAREAHWLDWPLGQGIVQPLGST